MSEKKLAKLLQEILGSLSSYKLKYEELKKDYDEAYKIAEEIRKLCNEIDSLSKGEQR